MREGAKRERPGECFVIVIGKVSSETSQCLGKGLRWAQCMEQEQDMCSSGYCARLEAKSCREEAAHRRGYRHAVAGQLVAGAGCEARAREGGRTTDDSKAARAPAVVYSV